MSYLLYGWYRVRDAYPATLEAPLGLPVVTWNGLTVTWQGEDVTWTGS